MLDGTGHERRTEATGPRPSGTPTAPARRRWWRAAVLVPVLIGVLAFGLRIAQSGTLTLTTDEEFWLTRADGFRSALVEGDLAKATAAGHVTELDNATMPGVTTMWAANAGRGLAHLGAELGIVDATDAPSERSTTDLRAGRGVIAATSATLIGLVVAFGWALFGRIAATVAGVLLATEPWYVGLGNVLHTDQMVGLFGAVSLLSLAWAQGLGHRSDPAAQPVDATKSRVWPLVLSGACGGLAILTKLSALALVLPGVLIVLGAAWGRAAPGGRSLRATAAVVAWWAGSALIVFVALWPALWVAPIEQIRLMVDSAGLAGEGHSQYFFGSTTADPGVGYYPIAWAFRMTPWVFVGSVAVVIVIVTQGVRWFRRRRAATATTGAASLGPLPGWLLLVGIPYALVISLAPKKLDRYVTVLFPLLALAIGLVVADVWTRLRRHPRVAAIPRRVLAIGAVAVILAVSIPPLLQAPYAIASTNPMLGGQRVAQRVILLGWGEGRAAMGEAVARREAGSCDQVTVAVNGPGSPILVPCGTPVSIWTWMADPQPGDYLITTIDLEQRAGPSLEALLPGLSTTLVDELEIGGVPYARLWQVD